MMAGRLDGLVAIVAGAGQQPGEMIGNGRAIARTFAREGAQVVCVDRDLARAQDTVDEIRGEGGAATAHHADVTEQSSCDEIVRSAVESFGRVDVLAHNVGIGSAGDGPPHRCSDDAFERVFSVNFTGAWNMIRAALEPMRAAERGAIVTISSLASIAGGGMLAYEVSKAALNRLTVSVARTNASRGIRANAILPGLMDTPMGVGGTAERDGRSVDEQRAARHAMVPLKGGMGTGWDTAKAALFLASDEARFITGVLLPVDGGGSIRVG
jgi:NAD(P)-dependent dehydrogenase (short-subunit alcohol dehydrogenase family)